MREKINQIHQDWFSQISIILISSTLLCVGGVLYTLISSNMVFAGDLKPIKEEIVEIRGELADLKEADSHQILLVEKVIREQQFQRALYYEDRIRELEVDAMERKLTPTEAQRLLRYRDDLNQLERMMQ